MRRLISICQACLAILLCLAILTACGAKQTATVAAPETKDAATDPATDPDDVLTDDDWDNIVAQFGNHTLTAAGFSYFYWASYTSFLTYHGSDAQNYLDLYTPLDQQMYSDELTWQDYFINDALMAFRQYCVLNDQADAAGFELSETAQNALANAEEELQSTAEAMGFETVDEYLKANYGNGATLDNYLEYVHDHFVVQEYTAQLQDSFDFTDEEIEAYYDDHAEDYEAAGVYKTDVKMAQLRYLMILPADDSDESYDAIDSAFYEMLDDWEQWEDKSEQGFMSFGEKWSEQGFAQDFLDAVAPGKIYFSYFDDWVFDEPRSPGDTRTWIMESGDYLFYYVGELDDVYWRSQTRYDMCRDTFTTFLLEQISLYSYTVHEENIIISAADDLYTDTDDLLEALEGLEEGE